MYLHRLIAVASIMVMGATCAVYAAGAIQFGDYPASIYQNVKAPLRLDTEQARKFRTRLREAAQKPINFGGKYVFVPWGAGKDCAHGAAIDVQTGIVSFLPEPVCFQGDTNTPFEFQRDSRLIRLSGRLGGRDPDGYHYFEMTESGFTIIQTRNLFNMLFGGGSDGQGEVATTAASGTPTPQSRPSLSKIEPSAGGERVNIEENPTVAPLLTCYEMGLKARLHKLAKSAPSERHYVARMLFLGGTPGVAREVRTQCEKWYTTKSGIQGDLPAIVAAFAPMFEDYTYAEERVFLKDCISRRQETGWDVLAVECQKSLNEYLPK